jgi:hypothetical protein
MCLYSSLLDILLVVKVVLDNSNTFKRIELLYIQVLKFYRLISLNSFSNIFISQSNKSSHSTSYVPNLLLIFYKFISFSKSIWLLSSKIFWILLM